MNLSDVKEQGILLEQDLKDVGTVINSLVDIANLSVSWQDQIISMILNLEFVGNGTSHINNGNSIKNTTKQNFNEFVQKLKDIDFSDSLCSLGNLEKYNYFGVNDFVEEYKKFYKIIHKLIREKSEQEALSLFYRSCVAINSIIAQYRCVFIRIRNIEELHKILVSDIEESNDSGLKIRLLKEDDNVSSLIENIEIIESIYNAINILIGDTEQNLKYRRAESGTFELYLAGCGFTLSGVFKVIEFMYKVYSENFSRKAKQEEQLREIKIRKETIQLIKEIKQLNISDNDLIQECLKDIELGGRELFINNPTIKLNDEQIGLDEGKIQTISKEFIEANIPQIEEKEIAVDGETQKNEEINTRNRKITMLNEE